MQGFNMGRYVPPDQEGVVSGNKLNKKHALGARAAKLASEGILTVRFEMPFAVWCSSCPQPTLIGQGVRFNAEKKKVGQYYSTPVFSFRMRHAACGGAIEIRTDPQHTTYAVVAGAKKRDTGDADAESLVKSGEFAIVTDRERRDQRESAFANLEKTIADREQLALAKVRIEELQDASARGWDDPYAQNQRLRKAFRAGRKGREKDAAVAEDLKDRMSLGIDLLPGTEEDARRAALVDFGGDGLGASPVDRALARPLFDDAPSKGKAPAGHTADKPKGMLKAEVAAAKTRDNLASLVASNTRVARDPFLGFGSKDTPKGPPKILGIKRKLPGATPPKSPEPPEPSEPSEDQKTKGSLASGLVGYTSESD